MGRRTDFLPNITYDANGNILVNGAPIPGTGPVDLDVTPGTFSTTNAAGVPYVASGVQGQGGPAPSLDVDYTDAMAILNSPFAQTSVFSDPDLDGFEDNTGDPNLFEDLLLQCAATRVGLNEAANTISNNIVEPPVEITENEITTFEPAPTTYTTAQDLLGPVLSGNNLGGRKVDNLQNNDDGTFSFVLDDGTLLTYDNQGNMVSNPNVEQFQYDGTGPFMIRDNINLYDTSSPTFGSTSIEDIVNFFNERNMGAVGQNFKNQLGSFANAQHIEDSFFNKNMDERRAFRNLLKDFDMSGYLQSPDYQQYLALRRAAEAGVTGPEIGVTTSTDPNAVNYQDLFQNLVQEYQSLLAQQNQPTQTTQTTDMSGLMGLFGGGNPFYRQPSYGYGGGMGYGNPFFGGYGYGYGMNPYAGGIGSFYGNMGSGYSPSMYGSPFYGMYGGQNYNQRPMYSMPYNPYSTLYNQYSSPGFSGDMYTTDYQSYLDTPFEGQKYSQDYQDYLSTNNPSMYNNLFGTA